MTQPHYIDREAVTHEVKCWPEPFAAVRSGAKPWELRLNDRDYRVGDTLRQFEWCPDKAAHTGEVEEHRIGWALYGPAFGLPEGYVIMTLSRRPAPMEAVAWRHRRRNHPRAGWVYNEFVGAAGLGPEYEVQALAVIPTQEKAVTETNNEG